MAQDLKVETNIPDVADHDGASGDMIAVVFVVLYGTVTEAYFINQPKDM